MRTTINNLWRVIKGWIASLALCLREADTSRKKTRVAVDLPCEDNIRSIPDDVRPQLRPMRRFPTGFA